MARFSFNDADNYGVANQGSFFQLKNDKDTARVRFLYNSVEDVDGYSVHTVHIGDRDRYVNCLREYNESVNKCPLCGAGNKIKPRLFVKMYNEDAGECQLWERGKNFYSVLSGLSSRYKPLYNEIIEIERNGKPKDLQTTYQPYPIENVPVNIDDYDCPDPAGLCYLEWSESEMNNYIMTGDPGSSSEVSQARQEAREERRERDDDGEPPVRRRRAF